MASRTGELNVDIIVEWPHSVSPRTVELNAEKSVTALSGFPETGELTVDIKVLTQSAAPTI